MLPINESFAKRIDLSRLTAKLGRWFQILKVCTPVFLGVFGHSDSHSAYPVTEGRKM